MAEPMPGIARRLASMLYESLVVFAVLLVGFLLPQIVLFAYGLGMSNRMLWLHVLGLLMLYFVWFWMNGGQTLPMKTWKLRLAGANGEALRPLQAILRYLAAWPSILFFGIGLLWALFDKDRQFLHDRIAGTRIVFAERQ
ncbi:RDD family protein [Dechloromonas sp. H13]|uniref:RDD family protein n=1 Tax=Dechloromonas sp. H13 TaxID=2570193 RepID=UPI0012912651|nr:RDD family protein [Dechloromonas sp. H13]